MARIGELHQKLNDNREAAKYFERIAHEYERDGTLLKAVALLKQVIKLDPDAHSPRQRVVALLRRLELDSEAEAIEEEFRTRARDSAELERVEKMIAALRRLVRE